MKKRILLVDQSLTVQKVVSLTLDKARYAVTYAKTRAEAMKAITESPPDLILVSDQVPDVHTSSFPKDLENWIGRNHGLPPVLLITAQDVKENRAFSAVLKKPFSPQSLQMLVAEHLQKTGLMEPQDVEPEEEFEDQRLQKIFNDTFSDEQTLVQETLKSEAEADESDFAAPAPQKSTLPPPPPASDLWGQSKSAVSSKKAVSQKAAAAASDLWGVAPASTRPPAPPIQFEERAEMLPKLQPVGHVEETIQGQNLDEVIERVLTRLVPPIVERLVQERLDKLLKENEQFVELKP